MPGAPLLIRSNATPRAASAFSTAMRSGTWSVAIRSRVPFARPDHSASWSDIGRSGGEITHSATESISGDV